MKYDTPSPMPYVGIFRLEEASIDDIQRAMEAGQVTSAQLVRAYFERILQTHDYLQFDIEDDRWLTMYSAVLQFNPEMFSLADRSDAERKSGIVHGPLHGIPFMIKDNIAVAENMETTSGSLALLGSKPPRNAFIVDKLIEAGAILMGKTNLAEFANSRTRNCSQGFSSRGGQTRSPYDQKRNPGGSSSGSAVGVAANLMTFAIGTETKGSLITPATLNQLVTIKPTVGLTSRSGVIPISLNYDTVGPLTRTVRDAAYVLDAIYGQDPLDRFTQAQSMKTPASGPSYASFVTTKEALKDAVFGVPWKSIWEIVKDKKYIDKLLDVIKLLEEAGAKVIMGTELEYPEGEIKDRIIGTGLDSYRSYVTSVDFYNDMKAYLKECENTEIKSVEDIIEFNTKFSNAAGGIPGAHPAFESGQDLLLYIDSLKGRQDEKYKQYLETSQKFCRKAIDDALSYEGNGKKLSGILFPSLSSRGVHTVSPSGYPIISIPMGPSDEDSLGYGLAILQTAFNEGELIKWASAIEDLMKSLPDCPYKRFAPTWHNLGAQNLPVPS